MIFKLFYSLVVACCLSSCAVLSTSQLKLVTNLSIASDSVTQAPAAIFSELAAVHTERGLFYAASLTSAAARDREINALAQTAIDDAALNARANVYINVLNSYLRALRSISADARWSAYGTEWRGLGRNIDSVIMRLNQTGLLDKEIEEGWAKLSGQYIGYMSENYMRSRQAKTVRAFVNEGDTLVAACTDALIELLKKGDLIEMIDNESEGLKANYAAYLARMEAASALPDIEADRRYIDLVRRIDATRKVRSRCVTALQALRRAHKRLVTELEKRRNITYIYEELLELNSLVLNLKGF